MKCQTSGKQQQNILSLRFPDLPENFCRAVFGNIVSPIRLSRFKPAHRLPGTFEHSGSADDPVGRKDCTDHGSRHMLGIPRTDSGDHNVLHRIAPSEKFEALR